MRKVIPFLSAADMSAYLDGELDQDRRAAVERVLAKNPEMAELLLEYRQRDSALRQAFRELAAPIAISPPHRARSLRWRRWAAVAACCAFLTAGSWICGSFLARSRDDARFIHDATSAHIHYLKLGAAGFAGGRTQASPQLTKLLGGDSKSPDLSSFGFHLVAALKLRDQERPAVLFAYRDAGGRLISCYFQLAHGDYETHFLRGEEAGFHVSYRLTAHLDYGVVGTLPVEQLQRIADAADTGIADDSQDN